MVKDIPSHSIAVGVPAQVVKFKSYLQRDEVLDLVEKYKNVLSEKLKKVFRNPIVLKASLKFLMLLK